MTAGGAYEERDTKKKDVDDSHLNTVLEIIFQANILSGWMEKSLVVETGEGEDF